ncbi:hypothetical protein BDD12DRAFT_126789 [Trichophaea hybrida]|nr:hypothetical protein BDD12DRAFT_126789 [Trichophaea hybrida]
MPTSKVVARPLRSGFPTILLLIADTALLALSASKSRNSVCEFHDKWQKMFQSHDGKAIEGIQNALRCCGFKGPLDMPFPFPRGDTKLNACTKATGRTVGCADAWENKEGSTAMTLAIIGGVLLLGKLFSLWIIQRGADLAQKKREAEAEAGEEARFEEVEESDGEGDVEGARGARNGSPQPNETTPLMLEGSSPWIGESSVNGAGRGERERERDRAGH